MCGIAGIIDPAGQVEPGRIGTMLDAQAHRGPDGRGTWTADGIGLGHVRLAILDVSDAGRQPMASADGRYVITYNGEVYNYLELRDTLAGLGHRFRTGTDTEVLLAAWQEWGSACLARCNGMFAFAIHDTERGQTTLVRDRMGVKPLAYAVQGRRVAFASEAKALAAAGLVDAAPSADAIYEYLARGYTSDGRSFFAGVRHLPPGSLLQVDRDGTLREERWWQLPQDIDPDPTPLEWASRIGELLDDAVRLRLRSDVPVGAHLSGGLDSSAIAAAAQRHLDRPLLSFTGAFPEDPGSDERQWSRMVAGDLGLDVREVDISVDELAGLFPGLVWQMDEPIAGPGVFPQLVVCRLVAREGVTVVLGGQGGDELFGGYLRHRARYLTGQLRSAGPWGRIEAAGELALRAIGQWRRIRRTATRVQDEHLSPAFLAEVSPELREQVRASPLRASTVRALLNHDLTAYLPALLHVEDRTSMAWSLESRTPMLDYRLVELAATIPDEALFFRPQGKPLLRAAVRGWLPDAVVDRRDKKGFPTPLQSWQDQPRLARLVGDLADPTAPQPLQVFADGYLREVAGRAPSELWTIMNINAWLRRSDWSSPAASGLRDAA